LGKKNPGKKKSHGLGGESIAERKGQKEKSRANNNNVWKRMGGEGSRGDSKKGRGSKSQGKRGFEGKDGGRHDRVGEKRGARDTLGQGEALRLSVWTRGIRFILWAGAAGPSSKNDQNNTNTRNSKSNQTAFKKPKNGETAKEMILT